MIDSTIFKPKPVVIHSLAKVPLDVLVIIFQKIEKIKRKELCQASRWIFSACVIRAGLSARNSYPSCPLFPHLHRLRKLYIDNIQDGLLPHIPSLGSIASLKFGENSHAVLDEINKGNFTHLRKLDVSTTDLKGQTLILSLGTRISSLVISAHNLRLSLIAYTHLTALKITADYGLVEGGHLKFLPIRTLKKLSVPLDKTCFTLNELRPLAPHLEYYSGPIKPFNEFISEASLRSLSTVKIQVNNHYIPFFTLIIQDWSKSPSHSFHAIDEIARHNLPCDDKALVHKHKKFYERFEYPKLLPWVLDNFLRDTKGPVNELSNRREILGFAYSLIRDDLNRELQLFHIFLQKFDSPLRLFIADNQHNEPLKELLAEDSTYNQTLFSSDILKELQIYKYPLPKAHEVKDSE